MTNVENTQACFVRLWRRLERTRRLFRTQCRRYCIRRLLQAWLGPEATDDFIWQVCILCEQCGYDELPPPALYPLRHRELLRALVAVRLGIGMRKVNLKALDAAYAEAFPHSTPLNIRKRKRPPQ